MIKSLSSQESWTKKKMGGFSEVENSQFNQCIRRDGGALRQVKAG